MVIRHAQVLFVGLIAVSALQHSAFQATQAEAKLQADRLAKINRSTAKASMIKPPGIKVHPVKANAVPPQSSGPKKTVQRSKPAEIPVQ